LAPKLTPRGTETYNPADCSTSRHTVFTHDDTDKDYWDRLVPP
jgi:hypothetical protein